MKIEFEMKGIRILITNPELRKKASIPTFMFTLQTFILDEAILDLVQDEGDGCNYLYLHNDEGTFLIYSGEYDTRFYPNPCALVHHLMRVCDAPYFTIRELIQNHLARYKYGGLYNESINCVCLHECLIPCNNIDVDNCRAIDIIDFTLRKKEPWGYNFEGANGRRFTKNIVSPYIIDEKE